MNNYKETYELIEPIINALPTTISITNVVDNGNDTHTIFTNQTLHLQASNTIIDIGGNDYTVTEVVNNYSITVVGVDAIVVDTFEIYPIKFYHGTQIRTNIELSKEAISINKFPMVYLYEVLREQNNLNDLEVIGREVDLRLYFLTETDFVNKDNEQRYVDAVKPMRNAYNYFIEALEQFFIVGDIDNSETTPYPIFGVETEHGMIRNIFNSNLGGVRCTYYNPF